MTNIFKKTLWKKMHSTSQVSRTISCILKTVTVSVYTDTNIIDCICLYRYKIQDTFHFLKKELMTYLVSSIQYQLI